jgi:colanic acid/amylovoran biosynthesis glycosyltransferase
LKISYFINQYPKVSHSFVRREILALERQGFEIQRIALRGWDERLFDPEDISEQGRTRYVLRGGVSRLLRSAFLTFLKSPARFLLALRLAFKLSLESDRRLLHHLAYLAEACVLRAWVAHYRSVHVHAHFGTNSATVVALARALGSPPYSFTVHGPEEFMRPLALGRKIRDAAFVVAISSFGRSQLFLLSRFEDWTKIKVVHCGLEDSFHAGVPMPAVVAPRLICVGRLCEAKGQLLLIEAVAKLVNAGVKLEMVLAGDGPMRHEIEQAIKAHGLDGVVRVTGWISSGAVRDEILAARALILPTFAEGLPVVIMEAMALRRPVLTTYVAGIPELVKHGVNGWLIPAGEVDELAEAVRICLATSHEELGRMGDAGHERVIERHSADREAAKLAVLFRACGSGD